MRWGWAIWNLSGIDEAAKCRLAARLGFDFVSFVLSPAHWRRNNPSGEAATSGLLAGLGLGWTVHCAFGKAGDPATSGRLPAALDEIVEFAEAAGPPLSVPFDPGYSDGPGGEHLYDEEATSRGLEAALGRLSALGCPIALENWPCNSEPEQFERLRRRFGGLGMLLDLGHMNIHLRGRGGRELERYVASLPLPIVDLHMHDNTGASDQHLPLGEGKLDLAAAAHALAARGYDGPATVEVCPGLRALDAGVPGDIEKVRRTLEAARKALTSRARPPVTSP